MDTLFIRLQTSFIKNIKSRKGKHFMSQDNKQQHTLREDHNYVFIKGQTEIAELIIGTVTYS